MGQFTISGHTRLNQILLLFFLPWPIPISTWLSSAWLAFIVNPFRAVKQLCAALPVLTLFHTLSARAALGWESSQCLVSTSTFCLCSVSFFHWLTMLNELCCCCLYSMEYSRSSVVVVVVVASLHSQITRDSSPIHQDGIFLLLLLLLPPFYSSFFLHSNVSIDIPTFSQVCCVNCWTSFFRLICLRP